MNFKKKSIIVKIFAIVLTLSICFGTVITGVYAMDFLSLHKTSQVILTPTGLKEKEQSSISVEGIAIDPINVVVMEEEKAGIKVTFINESERMIEDVFVRIKFPDHNGNVDYSTKNQLSPFK